MKGETAYADRDLEPAVPDAAGVRLTPAIVLPAQLFGGRPAVLQPEKRLMLAVLEDVLGILLRSRPARGAVARRTVEEAEAWLASDDGLAPFAFLRICEFLGLDPGRLRDRVATVRAAGASGNPPLAYTVRRMAGGRHAIGG